MKKIIAAIALLGTVGLVGCWIPVQVSAPSENVAFILVQKTYWPGGRVVRCQGPGQCLDVYEP